MIVANRPVQQQQSGENQQRLEVQMEKARILIPASSS